MKTKPTQHICKGNSQNEPWWQWQLCLTKTWNTIYNVVSNTTQASSEKKDHAIVYWHLLQYNYTVAPQLRAKAQKTTCAVEQHERREDINNLSKITASRKPYYQIWHNYHYYQWCCGFDLQYYRIHTDKQLHNLLSSVLSSTKSYKIDCAVRMLAGKICE